MARWVQPSKQFSSERLRESPEEAQRGGRGDCPGQGQGDASRDSYGVEGPAGSRRGPRLVGGLGPEPAAQGDAPVVRRLGAPRRPMREQIGDGRWLGEEWATGRRSQAFSGPAGLHGIPADGQAESKGREPRWTAELDPVRDSTRRRGSMQLGAILPA